jgi:hypothetical protein
MKPWRFAVVPMALLASQAHAETWVTVGTSSSGDTVFVDKDSIRQGSDHLVYFTDKSFEMKSENAADCRRHIYYPISLGEVPISNWRDHGQAHPMPGPKAEVKYVCANAG